MKRKSQDQHDQLVKKVYDHFSTHKFTDIKADLIGYKSPLKIKWKDSEMGHVPDVTARGNKLILVEVETSDSINDDHTIHQWTLFSAHAEINNFEFLVAVPIGCKALAENRLKELNINGKVWEIRI